MTWLFLFPHCKNFFPHFQIHHLQLLFVGHVLFHTFNELLTTRTYDENVKIMSF